MREYERAMIIRGSAGDLHSSTMLLDILADRGFSLNDV